MDTAAQSAAKPPAPTAEPFDLGRLASLRQTYLSRIEPLAIGERLRFDYDDLSRAWSYRTIAWRHAKAVGKKFTFRDTEDGMSLIRTA